MKEFLKKMWMKRLLSEERLRGYCPVFLTSEEVEEILSEAALGKMA